MSLTRQLISAIESKNNREVSKLLEKMDVGEVNKKENEETALHVACERFNNEALDLLLAKPGIDINIKGKWWWGKTPLHTACLDNNDYAASKILATPHVDVNAKSRRGWSALHYACSNNNHQIVSALLASPGIHVNVRSNSGSTPVMTSEGIEALTRMLEDPRVDLNAQDDDGSGLDVHWSGNCGDEEKCLEIINNERMKRENRKVEKEQSSEEGYVGIRIEGGEGNIGKRIEKIEKLNKEIGDGDKRLEENFGIHKQKKKDLNEKQTLERQTLIKKHMKEEAELEERQKEEITMLETTLAREEQVERRHITVLKDYRDELAKDLQKMTNDPGKDTASDARSKLEAAKKSLECPVCMDLMRPPTRIWMCRFTEDSKPKSATQNVVFLSNDFNEEGNNLKETETNKFGSISSCPEDQLTTVPPKEKLIENPTVFRVSDTTLQNICELQKFDTGYKSTFTFVEGCPSAFWIRQDTPGLANLQTYLETRFKDQGIAGRKPVLGVGSKVLAKFFTDGKLYRARMEEVMMEGDNDEDCLYSVRYTDYGSSDVVSGRDIQSWESDLDYIPDQAVSCRLVDGPEHWKGRNWSVDQLGVFHQIVGQNSGSLSVELRANLGAGQTNYNIWDPMFEAYVCRGGVSIVDFLRKHPAFLDGEPLENDDTSPQKANKSANILPGKSKIAKINPIESTNSGPNSAFPLKSVAASPEEQGSPIPSVIITEAKSKVTEWLENKCQNEKPPTSSPNDSSIISFRAKLRPQSKNKLPQSLEIESCKVTPVCAVDTLKIEVEADGSFLYFLSTVESPGKFYLHPVQKETTFIDNISTEIASHSLYAPKEHCVVAETVWALCNLIDNKWYRVRVEGRTSKAVSVRYIDYGTSHERISVDSLRYLPDSWVTKLPGLAVRCHLAGCSPNRKTWDPKSAAQLEKMVGYEKQNRGMAAKLEFGSLGVILITDEDLIINEKIVDCQK